MPAASPTAPPPTAAPPSALPPAFVLLTIRSRACSSRAGLRWRAIVVIERQVCKVTQSAQCHTSQSGEYMLAHSLAVTLWNHKAVEDMFYVFVPLLEKVLRPILVYV